MGASSPSGTNRIAVGFAARAMLAGAVLMVAGSGASTDSAGDTLWLAESNSVLELSSSGGDLLLSLLSDSPVRSVAVDASGGRVWFYSDGTLHAITLAGDPLFSQPIAAPAGSSAVIDIDPVDGTRTEPVATRYRPIPVSIDADRFDPRGYPRSSRV